MLDPKSRQAKYRKKSGKELKKQADLLVKQKEEMILREIADAVDQARFSFDRAEAARESVRYAVDAADVEEVRQARGAGLLQLVFEAQDNVANARIAEAAARRDYNTALSRLYFTEGSLLDRLRMEVLY